GLGKPYAGVGGGSFQNGVWLYKDLPRPGAAEMWDAAAGASYSFDNATGALVSYDTVASARRKAEYVVGEGLGGAVFGEARGARERWGCGARRGGRPVGWKERGGGWLGR